MKKRYHLFNTKIKLLILVFFLFITLLGEIHLTGFIGNFSVSLFAIIFGNSRYLIYIYLFLYIIFPTKTLKINQNKKNIIFLILVLLTCIFPYIFLQTTFFENNLFDYLFLLIQKPFIIYRYGGLLGAILYYPLFFLIGKLGIIFVILFLAITLLVLLLNVNYLVYVYDFFKKIVHNNRFNNDNVKLDKEIDDHLYIEEEHKKNFDEEVKKEDKIINEEQKVTSIKKDKYNNKYYLPPLELIFAKTKKNNLNYSTKEKIILEKTLNSFNINSKIEKIKVGPTITQYQLSLGKGIKLNKITSLSSEIALALAAKDVRIQAPIPGETMIGIEVPNKEITTIYLYEVVKPLINNLDDKLLIPLGKKINGDIFNIKLDKMPHLLVAGSTGSGKSVCLNSFIISILLKNKPEDVRFLMIDPKKVEFSIYNDLPHLLAPVVTDPKKASISLKKIVVLMEERYDRFSKYNVKDITSYNTYAKENNLDYLPYIVVIIDELADLMLVASKQVEESIIRISQMARAAGIHMILATQRPSVDVITGIIKSNIPARIAFSVSSQIDSRTILDISGAEKLIGNGDMIYISPSSNIPERIQAPYINNAHLIKVVDYIKKQNYKITDIFLDDLNKVNDSTLNLENKEEFDVLYNDAKDFALTQEVISISKIQRRFKIGFNRAARIMDELCNTKILSSELTNRGRKVIVKNIKKNID